MFRVFTSLKEYLEEYFKVDQKAEIIANRLMQEENFTSISSTNDSDIFIASYPKSGVTWMQNLITGILLESTSENISPKLVGEIVPDVHYKKFYKRTFKTMFFKTHNPPQPQYRKVIHLVRDGRDSLVSYYHYLSLNKKNGPSLEEMVKKGNLWPSKWVDHTREWHINPYKANILVIKYENLISDPVQELERVAQFSGIPISRKKLIKISDKNNIDILRKKVVVNGWDYDKNFGEDSSKFFRRGVIGDYKKELNPELIEIFNSYSREMLKAYSYEV